MRNRVLAGMLAAATLALAGCGTDDGARGSADASRSASHSHHDKQDDMSGMDKSQTGAKSGPSQTARMVCEEGEIRDAVKRTFLMGEDPASTDTWSESDRLFTCRWTVPHGDLVLRVQDAVDPGVGQTYFDDLRGSLGGAERIRGMENFGFPAYQTRAGDVLFLKDGKTLHVDATKLPGSSLPKGFSRPDLAYSVAAAVIACWTE